MPGNIVVNNGGTLYAVVERKTSSTSTGYIYVSVVTASPNQFYQLGEVVEAYVTLNIKDTVSYDEYMFELISSGENPMIKIISTTDLYWPRELSVKSGYKYQFSILNGIVLWTEVAVV